MTDNETVTISADYFAKLHRMANETDNIYEESNAMLNALTNRCYELIKKTNKDAKELLALSNERDELKAKFAAAERLIEEIESVMSVSVISECAEGEKVNGIIRAYREAKEAK